MHFKTAREKVIGVLVLIGFAFFMVYLGYQGLYGNHGLVALMRQKSQIERLAFELEDIRTHRLHLERRTRLLRPDSLDLDLLDERARADLVYAHPDDLVILDLSE